MSLFFVLFLPQRRTERLNTPQSPLKGGFQVLNLMSYVLRLKSFATLQF